MKTIEQLDLEYAARTQERLNEYNAAYFHTCIRNLRFIYDPGHGWLEVPLTDTLLSGLQISTYSYISKTGFVYLEEDCDMALYMDAADRAGVTVTITETYESHTNIRNMERYRRES